MDPKPFILQDVAKIERLIRETGDLLTEAEARKLPVDLLVQADEGRRFLHVMLAKAKAESYRWRAIAGDARIVAYLECEGKGGRFDAERRTVTWPAASPIHVSTSVDVDNPDRPVPWES